MSYSFAEQKIIIPVAVDQSAYTDADVIFTWISPKKMVVHNIGFVAGTTEAWGATASKFSLDVADVEKIVVTIPGSSVLGTEVLGVAATDVTLPLDVAAGTKLEFIVKDKNAEAGVGYFILYANEAP